RRSTPRCGSTACPRRARTDRPPSPDARPIPPARASLPEPLVPPNPRFLRAAGVVSRARKAFRGGCGAPDPVPQCPRGAAPDAGPHVFQLIRARQRGRPMTTQQTNSGLEDVVVSTSEICFIDGDRGRLLYRGYDIHDLVEHSSFEETAALLWNGALPKRAEFERLKKALATQRR